jgi:hypothetical protein
LSRSFCRTALMSTLTEVCVRAAVAVCVMLFCNLFLWFLNESPTVGDSFQRHTHATQRNSPTTT